MWICPKCQQKFVNAHQWHSCGQGSVEAFLEGQTQTARQLFATLLDEVKQIGPYDLHPAKTRIALVVKMRFMAINGLGKNFLDAHLVLTEPYNETLCFHRVDNVSKRSFVHHFRLYSEEDITEELRSYFKMAYKVGQRLHQSSR